MNHLLDELLFYLSDQLFHKNHPNKSDIIASWGDTHSLLTRDRRGMGTHHLVPNGNDNRMFFEVSAETVTRHESVTERY